MYSTEDYKNIDDSTDCIFERSNQQLLVNRTQRNLLIKSEVTKSYEFLYNILLENEVVDYDSLHINNEYIKFFSSETFYILLKNAISEWVTYNKNAQKMNERIRCELCGYPIFYACTILNIKNANILRVGRSCASVFRLL